MVVSELNIPESGLVVIAGRPGMGKSFVAIELANEMNRSGIKADLLYTDGMQSHDIVQYENGETCTFPSKLSRVNSVYPDIPYAIEDGGERFEPYGWGKFLKDYIDHEKPRAVFINSIGIPMKKVSSELLKTLQYIAKEKHVIIFVEINVTRAVEDRKDKHPKSKDVNCKWTARKYVDQFVFVYRDVYYMVDAKEKNERIEVYTADGDQTILPFDLRKYAIENFENIGG